MNFLGAILPFPGHAGGLGLGEKVFLTHEEVHQPAGDSFCLNIFQVSEEIFEGSEHEVNLKSRPSLVGRPLRGIYSRHFLLVRGAELSSIGAKRFCPVA